MGGETVRRNGIMMHGQKDKMRFDFCPQVFVGDTGENSFSDVETSKRLGKGSEKK